MEHELAQVYKRFFVLMSIVLFAWLIMGCVKMDDLSADATPPAIYAIVNDGGVLCSNDTMITYRTHQPLDTFLCDKDGLTVSGSQNLKMLVTVSNFSPVKGEAVTVTYRFKKDESTLLDNCEISPNNGLHERVQDGKFTIIATGNTTFYQLRCINGDSTIEAEFTLRAPAFGG